MSVASCSTASRGKTTEREQIRQLSNPRPTITITLEAGTLGEAVRRIGLDVGGGLVLMQGIELRAIGPLEFTEAPYLTAAQHLAKEAACLLEECPSYLFIYPPGYEMLCDLSTEGLLGGPYLNMTAGMAFAAGNRLHTVFAVLSDSMGVPIVGDNAVADAACGELTLAQAPLEEAIEAALKSARVIRFAIDATDEYIFVYLPGRESPRSFLLNDEPLTAEQQTLLDRRADVTLPLPQTDPAHLEVAPGPEPLRKVLAPLSKQLGVKVMAQRGMEEFPVNPAVLPNIRVQTALDLMLRQWLVPEFGYRVTEEGVVIRRR